jgi:hypothetical protein
MEQAVKLKFRVLSGSFAICRLSAADPIPPWVTQGTFTSVTRTEEELSIVCLADNVPLQHKPEITWTCLKLEGPFAFSQVGILKSFIDPLVEGSISIFAIATFDTDYILLQANILDQALLSLKNAGHLLIPRVEP